MQSLTQSTVFPAKADLPRKTTARVPSSWTHTTTISQQAVETKLKAPVVSNEETHHFEQVATLDGRAIVLPTRITSHQLVLIAGRNLLVDKDTIFTSYDINPTAFAAQRLRRTSRRSSRCV